MTVTTVKIKGMTCGHCEGRVNTELGKLIGVTEVKASADAAEAVITSSSELDSEQVSAAVIAAGYRVIN
ncbi:MAG: copper chaperone [Streptomycetaceae bacterium]|nr:MAG: copper chaperone [Streptomycetaceae bacterium]